MVYLPRTNSSGLMKMPSGDNNCRKCFTKAWRHGLWASTCHLFQFFDWFLSIYCMERQRQQDKHKPIEPGTKWLQYWYETMILISHCLQPITNDHHNTRLTTKLTLIFHRTNNNMTFDLFRLTIFVVFLANDSSLE